MHGRVEAAAGALAGLECELDDACEIGAGDRAAVAVEPRELRVGAEPREDRLEPVELVLGCVECARPRSLGVDEQLDLRAHRVELRRLITRSS